MISIRLELKAAGYAGDESSFKDLVVRVYRKSPPRWTVDELTLRPENALAFCERVRVKAGCPRLEDHAILAALVNVRRNTSRLSGDPPRRASRPVLAARRIREYGYDWEGFLGLILDQMRYLCPNWNDQELLLRPSEAMRVCAAVRSRGAAPGLDDRTILGVLINARKRGVLSWKDRE